jgi:hypothetical protein
MSTLVEDENDDAGNPFKWTEITPVAPERLALPGQLAEYDHQGERAQNQPL